MFVVAKESQFTHAVTVEVPIDGGHRKETFKARFRVLDSAKIDGFDLDSEEGSTELLKAAIVTLDELVDENNKPVPYSDELRDQLIVVPFVRAALAKTYFAAIGKSARGN